MLGESLVAFFAVVQVIEADVTAFGAFNDASLVRKGRVGMSFRILPAASGAVKPVFSFPLGRDFLPGDPRHVAIAVL